MIPTTLVVLVVVPHHEHRGRYLVVEERDRTFYLPAGRVEPGESLLAAAIRETLEEAGITITLRGLLGFEHESSPAFGASGTSARMRLRFTFVGDQAVAGPPKRHADRHTRGAAWCTKEELAQLPLRHPEVLSWIARYESGAPLLPCAAYAPYGMGPSPPRPADADAMR